VRTYYSGIIASLNGNQMTENQIRVALMSNAGGSGKTTLAVNVGYELFSAGFSVCLFGLDPNASLKTFVGLGGENPEPDQKIDCILEDDFNGAWPLYDCWDKEGIQALLGDESLSELIERLSTADRKTEVLRDRLEDYPLPHDYLIFDCPGTIDLAHKMALTAADFVIIPIQPDSKDMMSAATLLGWVMEKSDKLRLRPAPKILGVVPNRVQDRALHRDNLGLTDKPAADGFPTLPALLSQIGVHCFDYIKDSAEISNAAAAGMPLRAYRPGHKANQNFKEIAQALMDVR
jgi:chromosome partitioning protein